MSDDRGSIQVSSGGDTGGWGLARGLPHASEEPNRLRSASRICVVWQILLLVSILVFVTTGPAAAQEAKACTTREARAFDFWIGNWYVQQEVRLQDQTWLTLEASTTVAPALGGCALIERWEGDVQFFWEGMNFPEPMQGLSVRAYDPETEQWYIHWMDTRTRRFAEPHVGGFQEGRGEFFRHWESPQGPRISRITFSNISDGSVDWDLSVSSDDGASWTVMWRMKMSRVVE